VTEDPDPGGVATNAMVPDGGVGLDAVTVALYTPV
jgi:hypothetical protein